MRMRDQLIVIISVAFATITVAVNVFAQTHAEEQRAENDIVAVAATWAQPIVPSTTGAPDTISTPGTTIPTDDEGSFPPGLNKEDCIPPGQVDRDKPVPPGQDRDMCVPPGQDKKDEVTPTTPPGQEKKDEVTPTTPPGQEKKDEVTPTTPPGQDKDKGKADG